MAGHRTDDRLVAGRYARGERLGHGGFGVVWRAHDTLLQRDVAMKEIDFPSVLDDDERATLRDKVLREARAAARLSHPGLVTVFDVVEEDGRLLIVMELVAAPTLSELVARDGPLDDTGAASVGGQVLEALAAAHLHGIVHRDVKPANVMVHGSGRVQLADFGIASLVDDPKVTGSGRLAGSPSYMSPEQAHNRPAGAATDLWGLGATLYFAVEGVPPFDKPGAIATMTSVVSDPPRPMRRATALGPLLHDLLQKDPARRPSTDEVRRRLADVGEPATAGAADATATAELPLPPAPYPSPVPTPAAGTTTDPAPTPAATPPPVRPPDPTPHPAARPPAPTPRRQPRRALPVAALLVLVVVVGLAGLVVLVRGGGTTSRPPATSPATTAQARSVPADWVAYRDPATGFTIARPPGWTVERRGTLTDLRDPSTGAYLRVDHQQPPGPSPEGAWLSFEPRFAADYADYRRVQITPTTFQGYRAAIWEFTYSDGGADLHAVDVGFIAGDYGFALNFQTHAADWDRLQRVFEQFKESFKAPA